MCNFIEWQDKKVIYKRYASLFFVACVDKNDNELIVLEQIHLFVEVLDRYFGNVCELDIIFNFHKAYYILDELFIGGHLQETSKVRTLLSQALNCALMPVLFLIYVDFHLTIVTAVYLLGGGIAYLRSDG